MKSTHGSVVVLFAVASLALAACKSKNGDASGDSGGPEKQSGSNVHVLAKEGYLYPAGTKLTAKRSMSVTEAPMQVSAGGEEMSGTMTTSSNEEISGAVLSATEVTVTMIRGRDDNKITMNGAEVPEPPTINPLEGKTLTFTLDGGDWSAVLASGDELSEEQQKKANSIGKDLLKHEADLDTYGTEARKVGDQWEIDAADMPSLADEDGEATGTVTVTFTAVEEHNGLQCAVLDGTIDVVIKPEAKGGGDVTITMKGDVKVLRSLAHFTDLSVVITGDMHVTGAPQPGVTMDAKGPFTMTQTVELALP